MSRNALKLAVIGGGSSYTQSLWKGSQKIGFSASEAVALCGY